MSENKREAIKERIATLREMLKVTLTFITLLISAKSFIVYQVITNKLPIIGLFLIIFTTIALVITGYISKIIYDKIDKNLRELENDN